jgi:hypothetical protein
MAKRSSKQFTSRALAYEESFFPNRNDMLQSSLDAVLKKEQLGALEYETKLEVYKAFSKDIDKELGRLRKLKDDLNIKQIDKTQAAKQWNAGQKNAAARTEFLARATRDRFLADKAFERGMYSGREQGRAGEIPGLSPTDEFEAKKAVTDFPDNPELGLVTYREKLATTSELAKSSQGVDLATAYGVTGYIVSELDRLARGEGDAAALAAYNLSSGDASAQREIATSIVLDKIKDQAVVDSAIRGFQVAENLQKQRGSGISDEELAKKVELGTIPVEQIGTPDYSVLISDVEKRIKTIEGKKKEEASKVGPAPVPLSEQDLIEAQRDEYFRTFYPGARPDYQVNRMLQRIIDPSFAGSEEAKILQDIISSEIKAGRMPAETPLGGEVEGEPRIRAFSGKQGPRAPGDILYAEGSPFKPTPTPYSPKAIKILSNEGLNQFFGEDQTEKQIQEKANMLFDLGLGLTKTTKQDGKVLYTVVPYNKLGEFKPEEVVMPKTTDAFQKVEQLLGQKVSDEKVTAPRKGIIEVQPGATFDPAKFNKIIDEKVKNIADLKKEMDRLAIVPGVAKGEPSPEFDAYKQVLNTFTKENQALDDLLSIQGKRIQTIKGIEEVDAQKPQYPVEVFRQPGGPADRMEVRKILKKEPQKTPVQSDVAAKLKAFDQAEQIVSNDELDKYISKPVGKAVKDLYEANKAKGDQTNKDLLQYIAVEFPKKEDQDIAASTLFALDYKDKISTKLV